ncbi:amino acid ABC transporter permease [Bradyrhizobium canariense]|uniref:amino acid ABC transporter permease n=1 Tax=Bradyrhizobium canariense TaxID=255045 RepID=UPI001C6631C1|nr:amino acid ABC transporter permease [Bradyrhizobium canariense]MBW5440249.1 amino acid ABC transporter permease [Bradyrhizobium canariense]
MHYEWSFGFLLQYSRLIAVGTAYTISFTVATAVTGFAVGCVVAIASLSNVRFISAPLVMLVEVFRCTPVLVQLVWIYYALPVLIGIELSPAVAAFIALSFYAGAFYSEIIRGGIASIDPGQWDAGRALGMRRFELMKRIVMPQALKRMIPPLVNQAVLQLKNTSLLSVLAVPDLLYQGQLITSATYRPLETYTMIAVIYFIILFPMTRVARMLETRLAR